LSAMAWRMVRRRSPNGWMTLVGDIAQTGSPAGAGSWAEALDPVIGDRWRMHRLTVNYRTPETVSTVAEQLLAQIDPGATSPRPVRAGRRPVAWLETEAGSVGRVVADEVSLVPVARAVAVLLPDDLEHGNASGVATLRDTVVATRPDVSVLPLALAKGLEFDVVVVVDPEHVLGRSPQGLQDLY
ncbi:helicase, partial [Acinetobacter baumannii]|nr:helicase [Acinetobacter baumannii]